MLDKSTDVPEKSTTSHDAHDGLAIDSVYSQPGEHPFDQITWEKRTARVSDDKGNTIFEQDDVEVPAGWSQLAANVVASKYFYGEQDKPHREASVRQLIHRVTRTIADWGKADGIFASDEDAERFYLELTHLCVNQFGAFNSPVWFNVGLFHQNGVEGSEGNYHWDSQENRSVRTMRSYEYPQGSACFIQSVDDSMEDIMRLAKAEAMLFKYGSGTGTDLSTLRSSQEKLSGGGVPSGPLSFMRIFDQIAAVVRSGGKTRRAAKMQSLRCDHPDIKEFIECKMVEEKKALALVEEGYDGGINGQAYASVMYQNANLSARITDEFMQAALDDAEWQTYAVTTGEPMVKYKAHELLESIAEGTRVCGDPGVQYHTTINRWNTCANSGEICASNPCSEYMFLNDSACNLASLNLMKFRLPDGRFDTSAFRAAVRIFIIAQEILVDHASYPSERICRNSHDFRPLGLGYANLGALIMSLGLPYNSDAGRACAAAVTAIMTSQAYATSAELAARLGTFAQYHKNRQPMLNVIRMHRAAVKKIDSAHCPAELLSEAQDGWDAALAAGDRMGFRNAQVTVLAPTGTIGFLMDCDTTGIEPDIALVKYKLLAGGGMFKIVNRTVPLALERLGYSNQQITEIIEHLDEHDAIEGAPHISEDHLAVFDCAFKPVNGQRCIHYIGHIRMMGAVQPFLSGAISKTINIPKESTAEEITNIYIEGWKLGLKAVAIYRDGSKSAQPLNVKKPAKAAGTVDAQALEAARRSPHRHRLPATRPSVTHKFDIANHEGYLNVGLYDDGKPGELFITMAKEGSTVGGMMDAFATSISLCLQYGVPLEALVKKFSHPRFEPSGMTTNPDIPFAKSIVDYVFRWLGLTFLEDYRKSNLPVRSESAAPKTSTKAAPEVVRDDAPSEPDRAEQAPGKEALRPVGSFSPGLYVPGTAAKVSEIASSVVTGLAAATITAEAGSAQRMSSPHRIERIDQQFSHYQEDAPACVVCGAITVRNGNCYKCYNCGEPQGCS
ncbi:MAG: vitamin B12-dependent ribonucleotide reductase [Planctomycetota bacterium]|nr:vitamin B12-dependent ribonucleotide reductase [Planctomycetota bacterium]